MNTAPDRRPDPRPTPRCLTRIVAGSVGNLVARLSKTLTLRKVATVAMDNYAELGPGASDPAAGCRTLPNSGSSHPNGNELWVAATHRRAALHL